MKIVSSRSRSDIGAPAPQSSIVVASGAMTELLAMADGAAKSPSTVLITGESGVGKDLLARYVHDHSSRRLAAFVALNCAGLTDARLDLELFGHVNDTLMDARGDKGGKLRLAHRGTLFLDQVGDMISRMQGWLLGFLENGVIHGDSSGQRETAVDVRVIAATNRNLDELVAAGRFREDLLYRLRVIELHVPPLRERAEDLNALLHHFLDGSGRELRLTDAARRALAHHRWPGNVRELRNVVEQLVWLSDGGVVGVEHLPVSIRRLE